MKNKLNLKFAIKNPHTITYTYLKCPRIYKIDLGKNTINNRN